MINFFNKEPFGFGNELITDYLLFQDLEFIRKYMKIILKGTIIAGKNNLPMKTDLIAESLLKEVIKEMVIFLFNEHLEKEKSNPFTNDLINPLTNNIINFFPKDPMNIIAKQKKIKFIKEMFDGLFEELKLEFKELAKQTAESEISEDFTRIRLEKKNSEIRDYFLKLKPIQELIDSLITLESEKINKSFKIFNKEEKNENFKTFLPRHEWPMLVNLDDLYTSSSIIPTRDEALQSIGNKIIALKENMEKSVILEQFTEKENMEKPVILEQIIEKENIDEKNND